MDYRDAHNQNVHVTGYPTEKNIDMLKRIIEASSNPGDLVLDCFAGSGGTLVAADMLGRNWIGIDNSPESLQTILHRFANGTEPMGDFVGKKGAKKVAASRSPFDLVPGDTHVPVPQSSARHQVREFSVHTDANNATEAQKAIQRILSHDLRSKVVASPRNPEQCHLAIG